MNILQTEDLIKGLPDERLLQEAQSPTGQVPQFLVVSEIQRRTDMRKRFKNQEETPKDTVSEQIIEEGIRSIPPRPPPQIPQGLPPQGPPNMPYPLPQGQGLIPSEQHFPPPPNEAILPPGNGGFPEGIRRFQDGGLIGPQSFTFPYEGQNYEFNMAGYPSKTAAIDAFLEGNNAPFSIFQGQPGITDIQVNPVEQAVRAAQGGELGIGSINPQAEPLNDQTPFSRYINHPIDTENKEAQLNKAEGAMVQGKRRINRHGLAAGVGSLINGNQLSEGTGDFDISDLVEQQKNAAYASALIQIGSGIAGNDLAGGLSRAGAAASKDMETARLFDLKGRLLNQTKAKKGKRQVVDGQIVDLDTGAATPIKGFVSKEKATENAREREIQDFMDNFTNKDGTPISRAKALKLQNKFRKITTGPLGNVRMTDAVNESTELIIRKAPELTSVQTPRGQTLYTAAKEGTGVWNSVTRAIARAGSPFGADIEFAEDEFKALQVLDAGQRTLVLSLTQSQNKSIREFELISKLFDLMPSPAKQPAEFLEQSKSMEGLIARGIARAETDIRSSTISKKGRDELLSLVRDMRDYTDALGVPLSEKEDVRSWIQSRRGFFDMSIQDQEAAIKFYEDRL